MALWMHVVAWAARQRSVGWETISNLVVIRNKIENVRVTLRRAIVVLVHAHVTLEQALSAVDAERVVGVVTLPCCNWFSQQETLFARRPDLVYDDFSILSDKREVRLWVGGDHRQAPTPELTIPDAEAKVCIRKVFHHAHGRTREEVSTGALIVGNDSGGVVVSLRAEEAELEAGEGARVSSERDASGGAATAEAKCAKALSIFAELLTHSKEEGDDDDDDDAALARELPSELMLRLARQAYILVLDPNPQRTAAVQLLTDGYEHVYALRRLPHEVPTDKTREGLSRNDTSATSSSRSSSQASGVASTLFETASVVALSLVKLAVENGIDGEVTITEHPQGGVRVCTRAWTSAELERSDDADAGFVISFDTLAPAFPGLDCVVDNRFVHRGFRGEKSRNAPLFRTLCSLVHQVATAATAAVPSLVAATSSAASGVSFVCVTPRRNWRKKEYLSHVGLQFDVLGVPVKQQLPTRWDRQDRPTRDRELTFVFCCTRICRGTVDRARTARALASQQETKDAALAMKRTLQTELHVVRASLAAASTPVRTDLTLQQALELAPTAAAINASVVSDRTYVQVVGTISGVRWYTKGMAFLSLEPPPFERFERFVSSESSERTGDTRGERPPLQAFLQRQELRHWPPTLFQDVLQRLHPGDVVAVLGFFKQSERGTPLLSVAAMEFVRSEFEAYG